MFISEKKSSKKEKRKKYKSSAIKYSNTYTNGKTLLRLFFECSPSNIYNRYPVDFVLQLFLLHQYEKEILHVWFLLKAVLHGWSSVVSCKRFS